MHTPAVSARWSKFILNETYTYKNMAFNLNKGEDQPQAGEPAKKKMIVSAKDAQATPAPGKKKVPLLLIIAAVVLLASGTWYFMRDSTNKKEGASDQLVVSPEQTQVVKNDSQPTAEVNNVESPATQPAPTPPVISAGFLPGSADPISVDDETVSDIRKFLSTYPDATITISGYASSEGDPAFNQQLSQKRADAFRDYLVSLGIPANRLSAQGKGITNPTSSNDTPEGRVKNRRVEVEF